MAEITAGEIKDHLIRIQGREVTLNEIRKEFNILPGTKSFDAVRNILFQLAEQRVVTPVGRRNGVYKVIKKVVPVQVFGKVRERRPPVEFFFPCNWEMVNDTESVKGAELDFAEHIVLREGDLITIGGVKSSGKTNLILNLLAENIESHPVLMGNEYTVLAEDDGEDSGEDNFEPSPRFLDRMDRMSSWVEWVNGSGADKFMLLPVREDFAEHVIPDRHNFIDWINLDGDQSFNIGKVLEGIKKRIGRGIGIAVVQKGEGAVNPRGGQFVRDFSDVEILLDPFGSNARDVLLTVKGVKEAKSAIVGKTYVYTIGEGGTKIFNFREVKRCNGCSGTGKYKGHDCDRCYGAKYIDK